MFYWTRFLYRQSYYWKIGFFKCPTTLSPLLWMKWKWDKNEYQQWFFQQFTRKKNQIKIEDDKASAISQPFRTIPLWARICASWCNCVPCFLPFLDASSHLYMRVRPSVRPYVRPSVCPSVRMSVTITKILRTNDFREKFSITKLFKIKFLATLYLNFFSVSNIFQDMITSKFT